MIKRIISEELKKKLKDLKKYKGRKISSLNQAEKDDLLEIIAKKLNLI
jgi:hypothetical protein